MAAAKGERVKLTTPVFRVSFPTVFTPSSYQGGTPKFGISMLFTPGKFTDTEKKLWAAMIAAANVASTDAFKKPLKDLPDNFKKPFRKGEEKPELEGYGPGVIFVNATSKMKPGLVDKDRNPILNQDDFYPGCYARATVSVYAYDNKGKGVAFGLNNLQKVRDGESFSGRVAAEDDFEADLSGDEAGGETSADPWD